MHLPPTRRNPIDSLEPGHGKTKTGYLWVSNIPGGKGIRAGNYASDLKALGSERVGDRRFIFN